jgi:cytochrome c biogenesis protein CcdA
MDITVKKNSQEKIFITELNSTFWKVFLIILAVLLMFAGPTYLVLILINALNINYGISMIIGFTLFLLGLSIMFFLIRRKIIP